MFTKEQRSTFPYWFAHWCAFQMTALNFGIWKFRFLFHDWYKPWMKLVCKYETVQHYHRYHSRHHLEWGQTHGYEGMDIDAFLVDIECSQYTKQASPLNAVDKLYDYIAKSNDRDEITFLTYCLNYAELIGMKSRA